MGNCMSSKAAVEEVNPPPHPHARRVWLVSTPVDSREIPLDLVGIETDGLKSAMRNRGLETEHWALKVDPRPNNAKAEPSIIDITVQAGRLVSQLHSTSSPYWRGITRRVAVGWTIWNDDEIMDASMLLIQARPKYDGRQNNSQQLARLLGRHIDFVPAPAVPVHQNAGTTIASDTIAGQESSPAGSIIKNELATTTTTTTTPSSAEAGAQSTPIHNRSQNTLVSGTQSQRSQSSDSHPNPTETQQASRVPASIRQSQRMSMARPPLIHLSTAPSSGAVSEVGSLMQRPALHRSAETEGSVVSPTGSVRMSLTPQARQQLQQATSSPLNPLHRTHRQTSSEIHVGGRTRTSSDAAYATMGAADRRLSRPSRRRSEAPAEWLAEMPPSVGGGGDARFRSLGARTGGNGRSPHRDSVLSLGGGSFVASPSMNTWSPTHFPTTPSMVNFPTASPLPGMPMPGFATPPHMPSPSMNPMNLPMPMPPMGMYPPSSPSMMFPAAVGGGMGGLQVPMPYFAHQAGGMPFVPSMPMLAPPSPGFHSHTSSAVHTPPESPHLTTTKPLEKPLLPEMRLPPHSIHHQ